MLKTKDNVDLKELEKFGFKINKEKNKYIEQTSNGNKVIVIINTRQILMYKYGMYAGISNVIVDLIKAGLVEKVDNSN